MFVFILLDITSPLHFTSFLDHLCLRKGSWMVILLRHLFMCLSLTIITGQVHTFEIPSRLDTDDSFIVAPSPSLLLDGVVPLTTSCRSRTSHDFIVIVGCILQQDFILNLYSYRTVNKTCRKVIGHFFVLKKKIFFFVPWVSKSCFFKSN